MYIKEKNGTNSRCVLIRALTLEIKTVVNKEIEKSLNLHAYFLHFEWNEIVCLNWKEVNMTCYSLKMGFEPLLWVRFYK